MHFFVARISVFVSAAIALAVSAFAGVTEVTTCGTVVKGKAVLVGDLDCSGSLLPAIQFEKGNLRLNGYTLTSPAQNFAVDCIGNCQVYGPGTITGTGSGIVSRRHLKVKDVSLTVANAAISVSQTLGKGKGLIQRATITGAGTAIDAKAPVRVFDSAVTGSRYSGIASGDTAATSGFPCDPSPTVFLSRTTVSGSGSDPSCGVIRNCADVVTCGHPPRLYQSSCGTSCAGGTGIPCTTWEVCTGD